MKKLLILFFIFSIGYLKAQTIDDFGRITLKSDISSIAQLPSEAKSVLETKLNQIATNNGIASTNINPRFVITAKIDVVEKDVVVGPPQKISQTLNITFYIGDAVEQTIFSNTLVTVVGVGINETKAYIAAIKKVNPNSNNFKLLIEEGKTKIIAYYKQNCETVLKEAKTLFSQEKYSQAIYNLSLVPNVCTECYQSCLSLQEEIYNKKIESEGNRAFQQAQLAWAQSPNKEGAKQSMQLISKINPNVSFIQTVNSFVKEVSDVVQTQECREWEQQQKEQNDRIEQIQKESDKNNKLEQMRISAYREIAIEYAKNQPKKEIYNTLIIR